MISILKKVYGDCQRLPNSKCNHKSSYYTTNSNLFYLTDDIQGEPVRISTNIQDRQLEVTNETNKDINVVKVDHCLIASEDQEKCDCVLFDADKLFFVEMSKAKGRSKKRKKAVEQLGATINSFLSNGIDISHFETSALICFMSTEPRIPNSSANSKRVIFESTYNVSLIEGEKISF